jgi:hypothetical protein
MDIADWVDPNTHGWVLHPRTDDEWLSLGVEYGGQIPAPLMQALRVVRSNGCRTVVVENRYVDGDFRSEFSAFWSRRFDGVPAFARRLHFFSSEIPEERLHNLKQEDGYLGYVVVRPLSYGSLGRVMISPPPELADATLAVACDRVTLFGSSLEVEASAFCQQDGEFFRCAHAAAWMCHYSAVRRGLVARQETASFVAASPTMLSAERALPSKGMSLLQLQAVFGAFSQPALFYGLGTMPRVAGVDDPLPVTDADGAALPPGCWDTRIFSVVCRYLNSGYPVLVATHDHAFAIVGWYREGDWIRFVTNDDQRGPYEVLESPFTDTRGPWQALMVPLPPRVLLSGEAAENRAQFTLRALGSNSGVPESWASLAHGVADKSISVRTVLRDASDYKHELVARGLPDAAIKAIRLARLPHFVWVVEAHDRESRASGEPCVIAEVILDSTSNDFQPRLDALLMPGFVMTYPPDVGNPVATELDPGRWQSSLPLNIAEMPRRLQLAS